MADTPAPIHRFYGELAEWWPLISPVEDYEDEAREFASLLGQVSPLVRDVLELGSGGGHVAAYLKSQYVLTLSDLSPAMLAVSARLNPECPHVAGDMRTLRLGQSFDAVFIHDAIDYMTTEDDLAQAMATAFVHCRPGGLVLLAPDHVRETFEPSSDCGGIDGGDGRGVRYLEWSYDPDPIDTVVTTHYAFLLRSSDGTVSSVAETHLSGLFTESAWRALLGHAGFITETRIERTDDERTPRRLFIGHKPA